MISIRFRRKRNSFITIALAFLFFNQLKLLIFREEKVSPPPPEEMEIERNLFLEEVIRNLSLQQVKPEISMPLKYFDFKFYTKPKVNHSFSFDTSNFTKEELNNIRYSFVALKQYMSPQKDKKPCRKIANFGGTGCGNREDGRKSLCVESLKISSNSSSCRVYSFGVGHDYSFEDGVAQLGCEVLLFDDDQIHAYNTNISEGVFFFRIRLGADVVLSTNIYTKAKDMNYIFLYRPLDNIMDLLGESEGFIDVLKIDIEDSEWDIFTLSLCKSDILERTGQIIIEFHLSIFEKLKIKTTKNIQERLTTYTDTFKCLQDNGFSLSLIVPNDMRRSYATFDGIILDLFTEQLWINERYNPPLTRNPLFQNKNISYFVKLLEIENRNETVRLRQNSYDG